MSGHSAPPGTELRLPAGNQRPGHVQVSRPLSCPASHVDPQSIGSPGGTGSMLHRGVVSADAYATAWVTRIETDGRCASWAWVSDLTLP
jgi:hypothetical protein